MGQQVNYTNSGIEINSKPAALGIRIFFGIILFISIALPLLGFLFALFSGNGIHFGNFILLAVFGLLSFFLLRTILWNTYGKETLLFNKLELIYEADYKWFKDGNKKLKLSSIQCNLIESEDGYTLHLTDDTGKEIQMVIKLTNIEIEEIIAYISNEKKYENE